MKMFCPKTIIAPQFTLTDNVFEVATPTLVN